MVGSIGFFFLIFWHLYKAEPGTCYSVLIIALLVIAVELLYFERDLLEQKIKQLE